MSHPSLKEIAYRTIREKILNGAFEPGVRIREDRLAEEIAMSRTPVREAINQLAAEGLLNHIPRRGIYLKEISPEQIVELLDVRKALETLAVVRCIENISTTGLSQLESIHEKFKHCLEKKQYRACNRLDSRFHREIAVIAANKTLIRFLSEIEDTMMIARIIEKKSDPDMKNQITYAEHSQILDRIACHDEKGAIAAIRMNLNRMKLNLDIKNGKEEIS